MVYLNRIYTKSGDSGETSIWDGTRVPKTNLRVAAYGGTDELNSVLGVALAAGVPAEIETWLRHVQNDLFDLGADLCAPGTEAPPDDSRLRVSEQQVATLEQWIDRVNERLKPLETFVLPGGSVSAAHLHHARTVCRRVEISVFRLMEQEAVNPQVAIYLNRLSDLLFVLARACNADGAGDVLWVPGQNRRAAD